MVRLFNGATLECSEAPGAYVQARVRSFSHPTISGEVPGLRAIAHALVLGQTLGPIGDCTSLKIDMGDKPKSTQNESKGQMPGL